MNKRETIKQFEKWAAERGMNIEMVTFRDGSSIRVAYNDHGTAMACDGWLGREELYKAGSSLPIGKMYPKPKPQKLIRRGELDPEPELPG